MGEKTKVITSICPEFTNGGCRLGVELTKVIASGVPTPRFDSSVKCPKLESFRDNCAVKTTVPITFITIEQ